jgi:hypothetical protein
MAKSIHIRSWHLSSKEPAFSASLAPRRSLILKKCNFLRCVRPACPYFSHCCSRFLLSPPPPMDSPAHRRAKRFGHGPRRAKSSVGTPDQLAARNASTKHWFGPQYALTDIWQGQNFSDGWTFWTARCAVIKLKGPLQCAHKSVPCQ